MSIIERAAQKLAEKKKKRPVEKEDGVKAPLTTSTIEEAMAERLDQPIDPALDNADISAREDRSPPGSDWPELGEGDSYREADEPLAPEPDIDSSPAVKASMKEDDSPFDLPFSDDDTLAELEEELKNELRNVELEAVADVSESSEESFDEASASWNDVEDAAEEAGGDWNFDDVEPDAENILQLTQIDRNLLLSPEAGKTRTAEEFRIIKRPLLLKAFDRDGRAVEHSNLIMVTSSVQSEGKTFTCLNLAISIAMELDSTVLLVDADVAKPGLSKLLKISNRPGLIETLTEEHDDLSQLLLHTDIPKLTILPAGERHKRSTELLSSLKMRDLLDEMASRYSDRIVLFDSPPLLESTEAFVLASQMGQVVLVVEAESTSQMMVKESLTHFPNTDNVSIILNKCKDNIFSSLMTGKYSGYGYYGYGEEPDKG